MISSVKLEQASRKDIKEMSTKDIKQLIKISDSMLEYKPFQLSGIHDAFLFHPNHFETVKQTYREILSEIASSTLLNDIISEITGRDAGIVIEDEGLAQMILDSEYALS